MIKNDTCSRDTIRMVAARSGRSNVGQIANYVMVQLERLGVLKGFCMTGLGAGLSNFVESAKMADLILIDGCSIGCGKKVLENHGVEPKGYFVMTELLGITKGDVDDKFEAQAKSALGNVMANI
jgi:uncharacterized metal-binding protein